MGDDARRLWPSRAVRVGQLIAEIDPDGSKYTQCPNCHNSKTLRIDSTPTVAEACVARCTDCHARYDPVELYRSTKCAGTDASVGEVVGMMHDAKLLTSRRSGQREALIGYLRYAAGMRVLGDLARRARGRTGEIGRLGPDAEAHAALGLRDRPHTYEWWTFTVAELATVLGRVCEPTGGIPSALHAAGEAVAVVVPIWGPDRAGGADLVGVWMAASTHPNGTCRWVYRGAPGAPGGIHRFGSTEPSWGDYVNVVVMTSPDRYVPIAVDSEKNGYRCALALLGPGDVRGSAGLLDRYDSRRTYVYGSEMVETLAVATALDCRYVGRDRINEVLHGDRVDAPYWERAIHALLEGPTPRQTVREILEAVGWGPVAADRAVAVGRLTVEETWRLAEVHLHPDRGVPAVVVPVRRGLSVRVGPGGWWWNETGALLCAAVPRVERVYRDDAGRVRHAGHIILGNKAYPFDTRHFRRDPVGVIDRVLLAAGTTPPAVHPAVAPHLANLAVYLGKRRPDDLRRYTKGPPWPKPT